MGEVSLQLLRRTSPRKGLALLGLLTLHCREPSETKPAPASAVASSEPPPRVLYIPSAEPSSGPSLELVLPQRRPCPPEMVVIPGRFCIDRHELHLERRGSSDILSPFYTPSTPERLSAHYSLYRDVPGRGPFRALEVPAPAPFQLLENVEYHAVSRAGVTPQGYLSLSHVKRACENAGKRLCRREEWVLACRGQTRTHFPYGDQYKEGLCNVHRSSHPAVLLHGRASEHHRDPRLSLTFDSGGPLLAKTGERTQCQSHWGDDALFDMVGNIDEWIDDPEGVFVGGFYSRGTKAGCEAAIDVHGPDYLDYSLGGRCCANLDSVREDASSSAPP